MAQEWYASCKDCGKEFGYSHASHELSSRRGMSRPERCPNCRRLHSREISTLGLSHIDLTPTRPIPPSGLKPGLLGGLTRPERIHQTREMVGKVDFDEKFGVKDEHIREYFALMQKHQVTVVVAPTGAGKSTFLPYRLMIPPEPFAPDLWTRHGQIIVTQPRIQATRGIPTYVAGSLHGSSLGAGFDIGFRHSGSPATDWRNKMVYMTDGSLINMIVRNELGHLGVIMIDEAHERSVNIDLILGLLKAQLPRYPHLRLIIASATIDTELFGNYYGIPQEAIYEFPGKRKFPVETFYREDDPIPLTQFSGRMPEEIAKKAFDILLAMETKENAELITMSIDGTPTGPARGDILAFLQGQKPIEQAVTSLRDLIEEEPHLSGKVDVLPLFTRLPQHEQDKALQPKKNKNRWRVVISTNVAETSLTVEGVVHVIETGLINESQWDPQTQTTFVVPKQHSQSGCRQRWGRAGRVQPGMAHCLYTKDQFGEFPEYTDPEIVRAPIDQIILTAKAAGVSDIVKFDWIQRPSEAELARSPHYLRQIGALDADGDITDHGLELRNFAEEIDVANLMIVADRLACTVEMATIIPMLKVGGYRALLQWDRSWDAFTKRTVHRIHQGLMAPCQDDVEFYLKLWASWEDADNQAIFQTKLKGKQSNHKKNKKNKKKGATPRSRWATRHFVNHTLLQKVETERQSLLASLSGHKKEEKFRPIDFTLLTRLRIVLTYGLSSQIYQLTNADEIEKKHDIEPEYRPYLVDPDENPEVKSLHEDAKVEIGPESVCFNQALHWFVCGRRQRVRRRESPQKEPETKIIASFLSLIKPEWLLVIGKPPITVARMIASETRMSSGELVPTTTHDRLFIDQAYPIGSTFSLQIEHESNRVKIGKMHQGPRRLRASRSYEEVEDSDQIEVLEKETELDVFAGLDKKDKTQPIILDENEKDSWDVLYEDEEYPYTESEAATLVREKELFFGKITNSSLLNSVQVKDGVIGTVVGYDFNVMEEPLILFEIQGEPDPFQEFIQRYRVDSDIEVEVVKIENYVNDWLLYFIVREVETQLEIVMDPYDASIIGRNFALELFHEAPAGTKVTATIESIDERSRRVRVSRLKSSEAAALELMGRQKKKIVDSYIADVRENGLYLWLDYKNTKNYAPVGVFVYISNLIQRPDEMKIGEECRVEVEHRNWRKPLRRTLDFIDDQLIEVLSKEVFGNHLRWDEVTKTLSLKGRMPYGQRRKLLSFSEDGRYCRIINTLFRRSNELHAKILDVTGVEVLSPQVGKKTTAKVLKVTNDFVDIEIDGGLQTGVPKFKAIYDRGKELQKEIEKGEDIDVWVEGVDLERVQAELSLLNPEKDPLNNYKPGQILHGQVVNIIDSGAFIELSPGAQGRVYVRELAWHQVDKIRDFIHSGQSVKVQILDIQRKKRRMDLTMRLPENDPLRHYKINQRVYGNIVGFTKKGTAAFVEIESGVDGFLYKDEISVARVNNACDILQEGQQVQVRITDLDLNERKMHVTIRGLYERETFVPSSHAGMVIGSRGTVVKGIMRDTKTYINLDNDGYCVIQGVQDNHVQVAMERIQAIIAMRIITFDLSNRQMRMMIGKGGSTIKGIQARTGARIDTERNTSKVTVTTDNDYILQQTLSEIQEAVSYYETIIQITPSRIGRVVGRGGSVITEIKNSTNTWINISKDNSGRIAVEGSSETSVTHAVAMIRSQAGVATVISTNKSSLPSYVEIRSPTPAKFNRKAIHKSEPFGYRTTPSPRPTLFKREKTARTPQPSIYTETLSLSLSQLAFLERRQGGFFNILLGGGKSKLEEIRSKTGAKIRVDTKNKILRVVSYSQKITQQAVLQIKHALM